MAKKGYAAVHEYAEVCAKYELLCFICAYQALMKRYPHAHPYKTPRKKGGKL